MYLQTSKTPTVQRSYHTRNLLFVFSLEQNPQISSSVNVFHHGHTHNYSIRSGSKNILDIPYSQT